MNIEREEVVMSELFQLRDLLFHEMGVAVRTTKGLLEKVKPEDWNYRPKVNMRSLLEVVQHLVLVPAADLAILQEKSQPEVQQLEKEIEHLTDPKELGEVMDRGFAALKEYMTGLSEEEFMHKVTKAFYAESGSSQARWLIEILTHAFHHRAQFFTYLKQLGYDVNMFDLY
jgi:uncharacterized damage-inducible protein DinB